MPPENSFAFVNGNARRFVEDDNFIVLKNDIQVIAKGDIFVAFLERNVELNTISGSNEVVGIGPPSVEPQAIFTEKLSYVADGESFFQKILELLRTFFSRDRDLLHDVMNEIVGERSRVKSTIGQYLQFCRN